jgi:MFS transporter, DHA1 family, multidrug resistance protein
MFAMEPILVLTTLYLSVVYGVLYGRMSLHPHPPFFNLNCTPVFEAFPIIFGEKRGFSIGSIGLTFIGIGIGTTIGCIITHFVGRKYNSLVVKWRGFPPPEERLYGSMIAGPSLVIGIFWLGWSGAYPSVHWIVPEIGAVVIGMCVCLTFHSFLVRFSCLVIAAGDLRHLVQSYTVDTYL